MKQARHLLMAAMLFCMAGCSPPGGNQDLTALAAGSSQFTGSLSADGTSWTKHEFEIPAPGRIDAVLDWSGDANLNLFLYDPAGELVARANGTTEQPERVSYEAEQTGMWSLGIKAKSGSADYTLEVTNTPEYVEFEGSLSSSGTSWTKHAVELSAGTSLLAVLDWPEADADLNLFLYRPSGEPVAHANDTDTRPEEIRYAIDESGTWSFGIKSKQGASTYRLLVGSDDAGETDPTPDDPDAPFEPAFPGHVAPNTFFWGASIGGGEPVTRHEEPANHPLVLHRTFYQWHHRTGFLIDRAGDDIANGRLPWVSIKPPSWAAMAAGEHDAEIDEMLQALDALPGPVWLTIHHEPEGGGGINVPDDPAGPAGHVAMNRRVRQRMTALGVDTIALAPILMSYTFKPGSGRNPDEWWAPDIYDFFGVDYYQRSEASMLTSVWAEIRVWAAGKGVDLAVGEWGMRGTDDAAGQRVHEWYNHAANSHGDGGGARVIGLSAFDSNLNSPDGGWELMGGQLAAFWELLNDPRTADASL